ncbi:pentapeptide repeat-containing protein [Burkholderia cepacia]|uniref:Pentapeptide repeat-containing protein n=1 Tax=Burkholderia cepacia TaxID=292 RepID=A0A8I1B4E4_BURCE|nr:pentapeptide repeat-containing protein [Burkholderia cepacia]MBA9902680.1 pentapeptide repeat-containing protein [Burkholderia cepacia]MBA9946553.1 pentapeptide repeat-containing protein [Burkholderia cepacia]MBA9974350.1 pentapeptide repeat-containing protein [Burkholderia cepacia]MBA9995297.1 pentapeptide repeat-containing protein [Burkholderia cepacia]MBB0000752.1 pentapeptide repeat-containing protein [Burkholderia cepacia]
MNVKTLDSNTEKQPRLPTSERKVIKSSRTKKTLLSFDVTVDPQNPMPLDRQRCAALGAAIRKAVSAGTDLRYADLRNQDLRFLNLSGLDLRGADLSGSMLDNSVLAFSNLAEANLRGARMVRGSLAYANLRGACLIGTQFNLVDLTGVLFWAAEYEATAQSAERRGSES